MYALFKLPVLNSTQVPLKEYLLLTDKIKTQPHLVMQVALGKFFDKHSRLPRPRNSEDALEYTNIATALCEELGCTFKGILTFEYLSAFAKTSCGNIIQMVF
jgi:Ubiquitin-activating enzyme E1 four-helix bundle